MAHRYLHGMAHAVVTTRGTVRRSRTNGAIAESDALRELRSRGLASKQSAGPLPPAPAQSFSASDSSCEKRITAAIVASPGAKNVDENGVGEIEPERSYWSVRRLLRHSAGPSRSASCLPRSPPPPARSHLCFRQHRLQRTAWPWRRDRGGRRRCNAIDERLGVGDTRAEADAQHSVAVAASIE